MEGPNASRFPDFIFFHIPFRDYLHEVLPLLYPTELLVLYVDCKLQYQQEKNDPV